MTAEIIKWAIVGWLIGCALVFVARVGKPRAPITSPEAVMGVIQFAAAIVLIVVFWR